MSMKNTAIGLGIGFVIWRLFGGILSLMFLIFLVVLWFDPEPDPTPTFSERRVARQIERNEELTKPNILIVALKKAIADRNTSEIGRLYKAVIWQINGYNNGGRTHLVIRDVDALLTVIKTCPVEIPDKDWGISQMQSFLSRAQGIAESDRASGFIP